MLCPAPENRSYAEATMQSEPSRIPVPASRRETASLGPPPQRDPPLTRELALDTDRFIVREVLGRGGSGVVLRAFDRVVLRDVAIKVLDSIDADGTRVDRFAHEARITGQLEHPNIPPIYDCGTDRLGRRYLCMKLIEGATLEEVLLRSGDERLQPERLDAFLDILLRVFDAVSFAHSRGVIHRDLKPINIMVSDFGQVYVLDWGIARLLPPPASGDEARRVRLRASDDVPEELDPPGTPVGTARYMAPEQIYGHNDRLDERTDVYSLAATLYQILTGRPPRTVEAVHAIRARRRCPPIPAPERCAKNVPLELSRIAMRGLAFDADKRYATVAEMKRDVESFRRGGGDAPRIHVRAGTTILAEGDRGDVAYVIVRGQCAAYRTSAGGESPLRAMGPGDVFGEMAVFTERARSASVRAITDVELLVVTRRSLSNALALDSSMGIFVRAVSERFLEADDRLRAAEVPTARAIGSRE